MPFKFMHAFAAEGRRASVDNPVTQEEVDEARTLIHQAIDAQPCTVPPKGWRCTRESGHDGPCAAWPVVTRDEMHEAARNYVSQDRFQYRGYMEKLAMETHYLAGWRAAMGITND